jgi:hypothetical protein
MASHTSDGGRTRAAQRGALLFLALLVLNACASITFADYRAKTLSDYRLVQENGGLAVAVEPLTSPKEVERYFGVDLLATGILPVFVLAENRSASAKYVLEKDKFTLTVDGERLTAPGSRQDSKREGEVKQWIGGIGSILVSPVLLPVYFAGLADMRDANDIKHNLLSKELQRKIIIPGARAQGFVYFQIRDAARGPANTRGRTVRIVASLLGGDGVEQFAFNLE